MKVIGTTTKCMEKARPFDQMVDFMKENTQKIKKRGRVFSSGRMDVNTQDNGRTGNNMDEEST